MYAAFFHRLMRSCPADFQRESLNAICIFEMACNNPSHRGTGIPHFFLVDNECVVNDRSAAQRHRIDASLGF
jgi:hypothetical protein